MSEVKFTKGPWVADIRGGCCAVYEESRKDEQPGMHSDDDRNIYYSSSGANYNGHYWAMSEEAEANAHLIAAAPAMYAMLEHMHKDIKKRITTLANSYQKDEMINRFNSEIEQLLAEARGEICTQ